MLLLKVLSLLAGVLALCYVIFQVFKKHAFLHQQTSNSLLSVIAYQRVDQKTAVCLIKAQGQSYLLAISADAIALEKIATVE